VITVGGSQNKLQQCVSDCTKKNKKTIETQQPPQSHPSAQTNTPGTAVKARIDRWCLNKHHAKNKTKKKNSRRRLVDEVDVRRLPEAQRDRDALQLAARQVPHLLVDNRLDQKRLHHVRVELRREREKKKSEK
jgi:hypothetical protein